jgi:hypothetical protein
MQRGLCLEDDCRGKWTIFMLPSNFPGDTNVRETQNYLPRHITFTIRFNVIKCLKIAHRMKSTNMS